MSVMVSWDDDARTRICFRFTARWTWHEYDWAWLESIAMLSSVSHKVDTIIDMTTTENFPPDLLTRAVHILRVQPRNVGMTLVATGSPLLNLLISSFQRIAPHESKLIQSVPSVEVARQMFTSMIY